MLVPTVVAGVWAQQLDEANAAFDEPPCDQALARVDARRLVGGVHAVALLHGRGLVAEVEQARHRGLHAERELLVLDRGSDRVVAAGIPQRRGVERLDEVELLALCCARFLRRHVRERLALHAEQRALRVRGQEAVADAVDAARRDEAAAEHAERGQLLGVAAETVAGPCARARPALEPVARVQEVVRVRVLAEVRDRLLHDAQPVGRLREVGIEVADPMA